MLPDTIKTRGLHVGLRFAPSAAFDKAHKQQFQMKASEGFDWRRQEYTDRVWQLTSPQSDGDARSQLKLSVLADQFNFEDFFPTAPLDVYLDNLRLALDIVADVFAPKLVLGSGATVRFTAQSADSDARVFLGQRCLRLDDRLAPLQRPVHAVGLRLLLPPLSGQGKPHWQAEVKIESLVEDVRQLFIETDARWAAPAQWVPEVIVDRMRTTHEFATTKLVEFLNQFGPM